jgi:putative chitinase
VAALFFSLKAHPKGNAADFTCAQYGTPQDVIDAFASSGIDFDQCILEGNWVHISFDPRMRRQLLALEFEASSH